MLTFADMLQVDPAQVEEALDDLREQYRAQNRGIQLQEVAGGWRLATHPQYHELIEEYVLSWDTRKLSQAALETLAIVAYCQPITRQGISAVRGVSSDSSVNSLVEKGAKQGRPMCQEILFSMPQREHSWKSLACDRWPIFLIWNHLHQTKKRALLLLSA